MLALGGDPGRPAALARRGRTCCRPTWPTARTPTTPSATSPATGSASAADPVIKHNVNARYATDDSGRGAVPAACASVDVPVQDYSHRGDLPCGSTIGPIAAAALGVTTVDVGMAQLSMHSAREVMATADVDAMERAFAAWFTVDA